MVVLIQDVGFSEGPPVQVGKGKGQAGQNIL